jgi:hypothetical protein
VRRVRARYTVGDTPNEARRAVLYGDHGEHSLGSGRGHRVVRPQAPNGVGGGLMAWGIGLVTALWGPATTRTCTPRGPASECRGQRRSSSPAPWRAARTPFGRAWSAGERALAAGVGGIDLHAVAEHAAGLPFHNAWARDTAFLAGESSRTENSGSYGAGSVIFTSSAERKRRHERHSLWRRGP